MLAMSPDSNIGSSTPIDSSGAEPRLRPAAQGDQRRGRRRSTALAATHHRNTEWPAKAVRVASNLTAQQALKMHVIDVIAPTLPALLKKLDGYHTKDAQRPVHAAPRRRADRHGQARLLHALPQHDHRPEPDQPPLPARDRRARSSRCSIPGIVLPGALGAVCLVLALYGFSVLTPSWGGLALMRARRRPAARRPARADARRAHDRRPHLARLRPRAPVPERARRPTASTCGSSSASAAPSPPSGPSRRARRSRRGACRCRPACRR